MSEGGDKSAPGSSIVEVEGECGVNGIACGGVMEGESDKRWVELKVGIHGLEKKN